MGTFPNVFRRFVPQLLHVIILPVFFFVFALVYRPDDIRLLIDNSYFGIHLTLITCIVLLSMIVVRLIYYYLPMKLNYTLYMFWCVGESIFLSFFAALYIWLAIFPEMTYFEILTRTCQMIFLILIFPYSILALSLRIWEYHEKSIYSRETDENRRMRFYDSKHNLKIVLVPDAILYIAAEENYINIYYIENSKVRNYVLRSSMKAVEELCIDNGLVRCHRSFFINPSHVKVLRKEQEGVVYAELDSPEARHIPVTKRYYDHLSEML